jgi:hypothetical protein
MTDERKGDLSRIMHMAWDFYRTAKRSLEERTFGDCLKGAWRMTRALASAIARMPKRGHLRLSRDLTRSPLRRTFGGDRLGDFNAAYLTARFGN